MAVLHQISMSTTAGPASLRLIYDVDDNNVFVEIYVDDIKAVVNIDEIEFGQWLRDVEKFQTQQHWLSESKENRRILDSGLPF